MILFLMVSAVRAPTVMAPSISNTKPQIMACRYEIDLDELQAIRRLPDEDEPKTSAQAVPAPWLEDRSTYTLVAQALATSLAPLLYLYPKTILAQSRTNDQIQR
jgi:hypothetical protein